MVDFGDAPVFEAIAYASILIGKKSPPASNHAIRGRDVKRWAVHHRDLFLIVFPFGFHKELVNYPAILRHLTQFEAQLKKRGQCTSSRGGKKGGQHHWLELDNNPKLDYLNSFAGKKVVMPAIERSQAFAVDCIGYYSNDKTNICVSDSAEMLCGVLNSSTLWWAITQTAATKQNGYYEFKPLYMRQLPIPPANAATKKKLAALAERAASLASQESGTGIPACHTKTTQTGMTVLHSTPLEEVEREIDSIVYRLFDLTPAEISLVETALAPVRVQSIPSE